jgi:hypothetical protein
MFEQLKPKYFDGRHREGWMQAHRWPHRPTANLPDGEIPTF